MKLSLPLRILVVQLIFSVAALVLAVFLVRDSFTRYQDRWERQVQTLPGEMLFQAVANEAARSMLLREEKGLPEEVVERERKRFSEAIKIMLREIPSLSALLIVDAEGRILYASDPSIVDLGFSGVENTSKLAADDILRRNLLDADGNELTEILAPVWDTVPGGEPEVARRRLGTLVAHYYPDLGLSARLPEITPDSISGRAFALPVILFLAATAISGVLIALITLVPVRRLERALNDFRDRDFRGGLDARELGLQGEFAGAVQAINELGGRLEALDARGREREALLATLSQSLEEGMVALDPRGRPVAWNPAALRILRGMDEDDSGGASGDADTILKALLANAELVHPSQPGSSHVRRELDLVRADGRRLAVHATRVPFEFRPGEEGTLVLLRDLATLRQVETHLLEAGRFAVLANIAAGLAHEIRNPLHAIGLNAGVVEQYLEMEPTEARRSAMGESLTTVKDETRRLTELLNNYLGLVRPERAAGPVDLSDLCRRVRQLLRYSAAQSDVSIEVDAADNVPPVEGFGSRLQQAILNLVLNSIQAMPQGGVVRLRTAYEDGHVVLEVSDTGPGLPAGVEHELFEMRVTTRPEGTGLGLPLVRLIAEAHGGRVRYVRPAGGGAAFLLSFPVRAAAGV